MKKEKEIDETKADIRTLAEESIRGKFRRYLTSRFCKAIKEYKLISPNDKIAVCISGGKDSMCMAKIFQEVQKYNKIPFELEFIAMDPGYNKENRALLEQNAKKLGVPVKIFETNIFESVYNIGSSPCYMCARMRRGSLYSKAKELGCNKIALGHHYDDVIETILMGMLYGAQVQTMMPKLHSNNFEGMELIRPMYLIREQDIIRWRDYCGLEFLQCACKLYDAKKNDALSDKMGSKRKKVKQLIAKLSCDEQQIEENIFRSVEGVNLATVISYKDKDGKIHSFLDDYDN
ncbi:MAG: ATPase [Clostridia bacterium]|nr:ATPase [Clostridia bacterium]